MKVFYYKQNVDCYSALSFGISAENIIRENTFITYNWLIYRENTNRLKLNFKKTLTITFPLQKYFSNFEVE